MFVVVPMNDNAIFILQTDCNNHGHLILPYYSEILLPLQCVNLDMNGTSQHLFVKPALKRITRNLLETANVRNVQNIPQLPRWGQ